jgi:long-subunit acyl-CoA synthetase (AMP-forming)
MAHFELCPSQWFEDSSKNWRFVGIQAKNRLEWFVTMLAGMQHKITTVAFYDTLGEHAAKFMVDQTKLTTMAMTAD